MLSKTSISIICYIYAETVETTLLATVSIPISRNKWLIAVPGNDSKIGLFIFRYFKSELLLLLELFFHSDLQDSKKNSVIYLRILTVYILTVLTVFDLSH